MKKIILIILGSSLYSQIDTLVTINASSYSDWVYFSVNSASVVEIDDPENSLDWDLAFQRKHIRTNSGLSGNGYGGAFVDSSQTWINNWDNTSMLPENVFFKPDTILNDFYDLMTHTFLEGIKNPALNAWGWFDDDYHLNVTNYVFYVLLANGSEVIKFWPQNYYSQTGSGGYVYFRYQTGFNIQQPCENELGDVNNDGLINVVDVVQLVTFVLNQSDFDSCQILTSDVNGDNLINVVDIVNIVSSILSS